MNNINKEIAEGDAMENQVKRIFDALLGIEDSDLSKPELEEIWDNIQNELNKPVFQENWARYTLPEWIEKARENPELVDTVKEIFNWICDVANTLLPPPNMPSYATGIPQILRIKIPNELEDDAPQFPESVPLQCVGTLLANGQKTQLEVNYCQLSDDGLLTLELQPSNKDLNNLEGNLVNIQIDADKHPFILGDSQLHLGLAQLRIQLPILT